MNAFSRSVTTVFLIAIFLSNTWPCGPGYITPVFDTTSAPEAPYAEYAAGQLGIIKPTFRRSVLYAAYRYIAGNGMNRAEQEAMIEVWKAEIDNKDFRDDTVDEAVRAWVEKRKETVDKDAATPAIYADRGYGGYDFFPNCTKNAFETATQTLGDRISSNGSSDPNVHNWVDAQDQVFANCANGKSVPEEVTPGAPLWLQKDRAYQIAAAAFYSLDYDDAKRRFGEIAQDTESPWAETADYLVARTLIRQASLSKSPERSRPLYEEAESHLRRFTSRTGKFSASAERLAGLIKYRLRPKERVSELAKNLAFYGGNENFRQDVIDYNWLLDKFENEILLAEEKRKSEEEVKKLPLCPAGTSATANCRTADTTASANPATAANTSGKAMEKSDDDLEINIYSSVVSKGWRIIVKANATDDEAVAEAERIVGKDMNDDLRKQVREGRQNAYANRFKDALGSNYEGGYWGEIKFTPTLLPQFLKQDELTDWLFTFQMAGQEAYLYSLERYKATNSDLWLMTALSKADTSSAQLPRLLETAKNANRMSAAYTTIAYHTARILLAQGKQADARMIIDDILGRGEQVPQSARNSFTALRLTLAETLEDFLKFSLKKPYAFDFDGDISSVDEIITEQKTWYDPETNKDGREAYDSEVENNFKEYKLWEGRPMFDSDTIDVFNQHFTTASLFEVLKSPALPDYMHERFLVAIWTRAYLLDNMATVLTVTPELAKYHPELESQLSKITEAKTQAAIDNAALYFVIKNPLLSPYIEEGMGKTNNEQEQWGGDDWWCEPYDTTYNETTNTEEPRQLPKRPAFVTAEQTKAAQAERKRLREIGDAPKFLAERVMAWAKRNPTDRRVPEAIYIMIDANGWTKYGCGNNEDLRDEMAAYLKRRYPGNPWTAKLLADETDK